ncbi:MAG: hypothetical protein KDC92_01845 [Bacteroidetes bacterium]|nr:hypothetical protein [Bacteroidota bacterium]
MQFSEFKQKFISNRISKAQLNKVVPRYLGKDNELIVELILETYEPNSSPREHNLAGWILTHYFEQYPTKYLEHEQALIKAFKLCEQSSERRSLARIIAEQGHTEKHDESLLEFVFERIQDSNEAIAVKAHCITIGVKLVKRFGELKHEFFDILDSQLSTASSGIQYRIKKAKTQLANYQ